jgi:hypothetical protein
MTTGQIARYKTGQIKSSRQTRITPLHEAKKAVIFSPMHFSAHIARLHSTFSLLAALLLRSAR